MSTKPIKPIIKAAIPPDQITIGQKDTQPDAANYSGWIPGWMQDIRFQLAVIVLLATGLYCNTFKHTYALDDTAVIVRNEFVHQGLAGIPDILTKDVYFSYYNQLRSSDQLSGGRYRPLSVVTFAIEQQLFGPVPPGSTDSIVQYGLGYDMQAGYEKKFISEMQVRHIVNVLLYALLAMLCFYFMRSIVFKNQPLMAWLATIIFTIHPLHTEVVANVKSRDEIMSLLFIFLTFLFSFRYLESKKVWVLLMALISYFLAFLSKEYAITLLVLLPVSYYVINKETFLKSLINVLPYLGVALIYIMIRWHITGPRNELSDNDIQINPYAFATAGEKLASEISTSFNYIKLLFFPHPLSSDYSYNQIPYKSFGDLSVWISILAHISLAGGCIYFIIKRNILGFALAFYLVNLLMICNIIFDIGATMGERLIFHSSVGFAIVIAYLIVKGLERIPAASARVGALSGLMAVLIMLCGFKTISRNADWKNDETLFFQDINVSPNSFLVNVNVAAMLVNKSDFEQDKKVQAAELHRAVNIFTKVIGMQNNYVLGYMNRCVANYKLGNTDSMVADLNTVMKLYPIHPQLPEMYYRAGILYKDNKQYQQALTALNQSLKLNPGVADVKKAIDEVTKALEQPK